MARIWYGSNWDSSFVKGVSKTLSGEIVQGLVRRLADELQHAQPYDGTQVSDAKKFLRGWEEAERFVTKVSGAEFSKNGKRRIVVDRTERECGNLDPFFAATVAAASAAATAKDGSSQGKCCIRTEDTVKDSEAVSSPITDEASWTQHTEAENTPQNSARKRRTTSPSSFIYTTSHASSLKKRPRATHSNDGTFGYVDPNKRLR